MRVLIDTCVIIDYLTDRNEKLADESNFLLSASCLNQVEAFISANSVSDIYYLIHHFTHNASQAKEYLKKVLSCIHVLDVKEEDCINAFELEFSDYENSIQTACAIRNRVDYIVTDNLKDYGKSPISAVTAGTLMEILLHQYQSGKVEG